MVIFSPDGKELVLDARDLNDAIELVSASTFTCVQKGGFRLETARNSYLRLFIPIRDWPCHSDPKGQKAWCDREGPGGFMGHTCVK
jgi:hypothetical protein